MSDNIAPTADPEFEFGDRLHLRDDVPVDDGPKVIAVQEVRPPFEHGSGRTMDLMVEPGVKAWFEHSNGA